MRNLMESMNIKKKSKKKKKVASFLGEDIIAGIDQILKKQNGTVWKQSTGFAPSGFHKCDRYLVYRLFGYQKESKFSARTHRIFDNGHYTHDRLCDYFDRMGVLVEVEREFWTVDPPIHGFVDAVLMINGNEVPVELKSISEFGFKKWKDLNSHDPKHYTQLQLYLWALDLPVGILLYENKNNQALLKFETKRDDAHIEEVLDSFRKAYNVFQDGNLPERPFEKDSKECSNCDAKIYCWADSRVGVPML